MNYETIVSDLKISRSISLESLQAQIHKNISRQIIEEKDYRDVSKVVLPPLYPSMFTVTPNCTLPSPCFLCSGVYRFCVLFLLTLCNSTYHDHNDDEL